jgi:hypothetical protein
MFTLLALPAIAIQGDYTKAALLDFLIDRMWEFCGTHIATTRVIVSKTSK